MRFHRGEQEAAVIVEPQPLGVEIDRESAALYDEFVVGRTLDELYKLWKDPEVTNPTIRQRAVTVLTAPHGFSLPYPHADQSIGRLLNIEEDVEGNKTRSLRDRLSGQPEMAEELARGVSYWLETTGGRLSDDRLDSRYDYHEAIRELLPIVSEDTADKLFRYYPINDLDAFSNMDFESGYRPLISVLQDDKIPAKYKNAGLEVWLDIARKEKDGILQPREEHESASIKMAELIESWSYSDKVDEAIFTNLVSFLESITPLDDTYVKSYFVNRVSKHINNSDLKFQFVWRHLVKESEDIHSQFRIRSDEELALVEWLREEAHKLELTHFDARAEVLLAEYESERREVLARKAAEIALQERLRA